MNINMNQAVIMNQLKTIDKKLDEIQAELKEIREQ